MKQVFNKFDSNKDGKISQQEYKATLKCLAVGQTRLVKFPGLSGWVDLDGDGFISFKEFMEAVNMGGGIRRVDIESAFRVFDKNGDGKITAEEVQDMLRRVGERCSLHDCIRMVTAVVIDGDDMVDMDAFLVMMTQPLTRG